MNSKIFIWYLKGTKHSAILDYLLLSDHSLPLPTSSAPTASNPALPKIPASFLSSIEPAAYQISALGWPSVSQAQHVPNPNHHLLQSWSVSFISCLTATLKTLIHEPEISIMVVTFCSVLSLLLPRTVTDTQETINICCTNKWLKLYAIMLIINLEN